MKSTYDMLAALPSVSELTACRATIRGKPFLAWRYVDTVPIAPGCRAYNEGRRESRNEVILCLGERPRCAVGRKAAFTIEGDARDWYLACYSTAESDRARYPDWDKYHPDGPDFQLRPWDCGGTVDEYARVPYRRYPVTVTV